MKKAHLLFLLAANVSIFAFACTNDRENIGDSAKTYYLTPPIENYKWEDVFTQETEVELIFTDSSDELLSIRGMLLTADGEYLIVDGSGRKIHHFDTNGKFINVIGKWGGRGPGEFLSPVSLTLNKEQDLLIFDISSFAISLFRKKDGEFTYSRQIHIENIANRMIVDSTNLLITYGYSEQMISKYDEEGKLLKRTFEPTNQALRLFLARFNLGGIAKYNDQGFVFIYPQEYKIYYFDNDLSLRRVIESESSSKFRPSISEFPDELSPYSFTPAHSQWWDKQLHIGTIMYIGDDIIGVQLLESNRLGVANSYLNVCNFNGTALAEGLKVPNGGAILCARYGKVFVAVGAEIGLNDEIIPPKLYSYQIRKDVLVSYSSK